MHNTEIYHFLFTATDGQEKTPEDKKKQYFTEELKRLQNGLKQDKDKIKKPAYKEHTPYIFSPPDPYCSTHTAKYLIEGVSAFVYV